jgi:hypothetical protein
MKASNAAPWNTSRKFYLAKISLRIGRGFDMRGDYAVYAVAGLCAENLMIGGAFGHVFSLRLRSIIQLDVWF